MQKGMLTGLADLYISREYFKEVSIETKTIVETIENAQGIDF